MPWPRTTRTDLHRAACALAIIALTAPAFAAGSDPAAASELFTRARALAKKGEWVQACPKFADSARLDPKVGTWMNLGECREKTGDIALALHAWQQAMQLAEATGDGRVKLARQREASLRQRVPRLTIELDSSAPQGTVVVRDGQPLGAGSLGTPLPVNPGEHEVLVRAPGRQERRYTVALAEGDNKTLAVAIAMEAQDVKNASGGVDANPVEPQGGGDMPRKKDNTVAYVAGGVGLAGVALAAVTGILLLGKKGTIDAHCPDNRCDREGINAVDASRPLVLLNWIGWGVGAAGLGTASVLLLTGGNAAGQPAQTGAMVQWRGSF